MSQAHDSSAPERPKSTYSHWVSFLNIGLAILIGWLLINQLKYLKEHRQFGSEKVETILDTIGIDGDSAAIVLLKKRIVPIQTDNAGNTNTGAKQAKLEATKSSLNFFDIILIMLIAGALGGVLCNLRGIFGYYRDEGELPKDLFIPYLTRPFAAAIGGIFIYFVSSLLVTSITLTPIAEGIGFEGMISYTALAIVAGFGIQEFMERLKALAVTLFGERQNETTIQRLRQIHRLKTKGIIDETEFEELKSRIIQDAQMKTTLEALNTLKVVTPPPPQQ